MHKEGKIYTVILAAGRGERFSSGRTNSGIGVGDGIEKPKCYVNLKGKTIITYSIEKLNKISDFIFVATPPGEAQIMEETEKILAEIVGRKNYSVLYGGMTRWESFVRCFLELVKRFGITENDILIEHDGARPLFSVQLVENLIKTLIETDADGVIPIIIPVETVRLVAKEEERFSFEKELDRTKTALIQTPQVFKAKKIENLLSRLGQGSEKFSNFTDLAGAVFSEGGKLIGIEGERQNIKITFPHDILVAEALLNFLEINNNQTK